MQFIECVDGRYMIYAGALEEPNGRPGYVATLVIKQKNDGIDEREAFRDLALTDDLIWSNETEALQCAVRMAHDIIAREPHRLEK